MDKLTQIQELLKKRLSPEDAKDMIEYLNKSIKEFKDKQS